MAAARAWIILAGSLVRFCWAEAGNVRGDCQPSDRQLSEIWRRSRLNTTVPALTGCHTIRDRNVCCLHYDLRGDDGYDWEQCAPAGPSEAFSSGSVCEPACWTKGACGSGRLQAAVGACHGPPDFGFSSEYIFGQSGSTCAQQGMSDVSEAECQAASAGSGSANSRAAGNALDGIVAAFGAPSTVTAPSGCIWTSLFRGLLVWEGTRWSGEVGANIQYLCVIRSFVESSPTTHVPTPAPTAAPTEAPTQAPTTASSVQAPGLELFAANSFCQFGNPNFVLRDLAASGTTPVSTVEECQLRGESDFNCGNDQTPERLVVTNAEQGVPVINGVPVPSFAGMCGCIIPGMQCVVRPTEQGNSVYVRRSP